MDNQETIYDKNYPEKDFKKTTYTFSAPEIRNLTTFVTLTQMGKIAEVMANNFVSNEVVKRLGVTTTADSGVLYDVALGQVIIYVPKVICSQCKMKKAEFSYQNRVFCQACADLIKKTPKEEPKEEVKEVKETKEPVKEEKKKKK